MEGSHYVKEVKPDAQYSYHCDDGGRRYCHVQYDYFQGYDGNEGPDFIARIVCQYEHRRFEAIAEAYLEGGDHRADAADDGHAALDGCSDL